MRTGLLPLFAVLVLAGCAPRNDRLAVHPVRGKLVVGSSPATGAMVVFHPLDKKDARAVPRGQVDKEGSFELSTYEARDGAPVGKYKVTIDWRKGGSLDPNDEGISLVPTRFTRPESTPLEVAITPETTQLETFQVPK